MDKYIDVLIAVAMTCMSVWLVVLTGYLAVLIGQWFYALVTK